MKFNKVNTVILALLLPSLTGCVSKYAEPDKGEYPMALVLVDDLPTLREKCGNDVAVACSFPNKKPCMMVMIKNEWEIYIEHEVAHCLHLH